MAGRKGRLNKNKTKKMVLDKTYDGAILLGRIPCPKTPTV